MTSALECRATRHSRVGVQLLLLLAFQLGDALLNFDKLLLESVYFLLLRLQLRSDGVRRRIAVRWLFGRRGCKANKNEVLK